MGRFAALPGLFVCGRARKADRESGFTALLTPGMSRVLNLPALHALRDKLAQAFLRL